MFLLASELAPGISTWAAPTNLGPGSEVEAVVLWKEGQRLFSEQAYEEAAARLQRFIDRYPGAEGFLEAHRLLGEAYLNSGQPKEGLPPLRHFIEGTRSRKEADQARFLLGRTYLALSRFPEARLVVKELSSSTDPHVVAEGTLLEARIHIAMNKDPAAYSSLESARESARKATSQAAPDFSARALVVETQLKTRACARYPSSTRLNEGQMRDQMNRRGICLHEAILLFHQTVQTEQARPVEESLALVSQAFQDYSQACRAPVVNLPRLTASQKAAYEKDLKELLARECSKKFREARTMIEEFQKKSPSSTALQKMASKIEDIERLISQ